MQDYEEIKKELEKEGYKFTDVEFSCLVEYARRKAKTAGKDESYLLLLIPDVAKEYFFRELVNTMPILREVNK